MYRSRLGGRLDGTALDYVSSVSEDSEIAAYDILGSQAHTIMLYDAGLVPKSAARRILSALDEIGREGLGGDGHEDVHELVEALVIKKAGRGAGGRMHTARSRNDQVALDMRMKIRDDINVLCGCMLDVADELVSLADRHKRTAMPLYTHMQQAQAGTLSHYLLAHTDALLRDFDRMSESFARVNRSPLGAGPVGGTGLGIDRQATADLLGFGGLVENSIDATSTRDFAAEYVASAAIMMTNLSRLAEDLVVWSSTEFSFIELSDSLASPSSVMPQKKNPDVLELTRAKAARTIGDLTAVLSILKGLATGYGRDLQEAKSPVWSASRNSIGALAVMRSVISTMSVNGRAMRRAADRGYLAALDMAERLVTQGMPFRTAHAVVGRLVQAAHESGAPLHRLPYGEIKRACAPGADPKVLAELVRSTTVPSSLAGRTSLGSPGLAEQKRMIAGRTSGIKDRREELARRDGAISDALAALSARVEELAGRPAARPGVRKG